MTKLDRMFLSVTGDNDITYNTAFIITGILCLTSMAIAWFSNDSRTISLGTVSGLAVLTIGAVPFFNGAREWTSAMLIWAEFLFTVISSSTGLIQVPVTRSGIIMIILVIEYGLIRLFAELRKHLPMELPQRAALLLLRFSPLWVCWFFATSEYALVPMLAFPLVSLAAFVLAIESARKNVK